MLLFIKKLFGAIFGLLAALGKLLGLGKKSEFYVEMEPTPEPAAPPVAASVPETPAAPTPAPEPVAAVTAVEPTSTPSTPTQPAPVAPSVPYNQFPRRRRPGANMASFLTMARQVRPST